jgi:phage terminase small subunit
MKKDKLTPKQQRFVEEYTKDFNATRAAKEAGYSEKTAYKIGSENLIKPQIQQAIQRSMAKLSRKVEITKESLVNDLNTIKDSSMDGEAADKSVAVKAVTQMSKMLGHDAPSKADITSEGKRIIIGVMDNDIQSNTKASDSTKPASITKV